MIDAEREKVRHEKKLQFRVTILKAAKWHKFGRLLPPGFGVTMTTWLGVPSCGMVVADWVELGCICLLFTSIDPHTTYALHHHHHQRPVVLSLRLFHKRTQPANPAARWQPLYSQSTNFLFRFPPSSKSLVVLWNDDRH